MNQIRLTDRQRASMKTDNQWLKTTKEQERFIRACPEGQRVMLYDDAFIRLPEARVEAAMKAAFEAGANAAFQTLGITDRSHVESIDCDPPTLGQTYLRVTVRSTNGRETSAIGMIPDPRGQ